MGRTAEGWRLVWRRGVAHVRFTHKKTRHEYSTGKRDPREAAQEAGQIYADVISGRRQPIVVGSSASLIQLIPDWLAAMRSELDEETVDTYEGYSAAWLKFFGSKLGSITTAAASDYKRARLLKVGAGSVRKELSALRTFLGWCVEQEIISEVPIVRGVPKKATGTPVRRRQTIPLSPSQVNALLRALPFRGRKGHAIQARFIVMYETSLRPATLDALTVGVHYSTGSTHLIIPEGDDKARFGRAVPLTARARQALDSVLPPEGLIFGEHDYREVFAKAVKAAGLPAGVVPYDLRHARLQHLTDAGAPLTGVAFMGGHKQLTTTNRYVKAAQREAERVVFVPEPTDPGVCGVCSGVCLVEMPVRRKGLEPLQELPHWNLNQSRIANRSRILRATKADVARGLGELSTPTGVRPQSRKPFADAAAANLLGLLAGVSC